MSPNAALPYFWCRCWGTSHWVTKLWSTRRTRPLLQSKLSWRLLELSEGVCGGSSSVCCVTSITRRGGRLKCCHVLWGLLCPPGEPGPSISWWRKCFERIGLHRGRRVDTDDTLAQLCDGVVKQSGWRQKRLPFFAPCTCKIKIAQFFFNCRRASFVIWAKKSCIQELLSKRIESRRDFYNSFWTQLTFDLWRVIHTW